MRITDGLEMLEISSHTNGMQTTIYPTLFWDEETVILVDTGFPGQISLLRQEIEKAGIPFHRLNKVILTHQDIDHIGNLPNILEEIPHKVEVLAHELEKPHIQGDKPLLKATPESITRALSSLPADTPEDKKLAFKARLENPVKAPVDRTLSDGEELPYCGGILIIHTPGHIPGHICLYHIKSKTLITGDAMHIIDQQLEGPNPIYTKDMALAFKSIQKLTDYDIERVISFHGGLYSDHPNRRIAELATFMDAWKEGTVNESIC